MRRILFTVVSITLASSESLLTQELLPPFAPGHRIRVTAPEHGFQRTTGTLVDIRSDTLYVLRLHHRVIQGRVREESWDSVTSAVPIAGIERLDVSRGRRSRWLQGLAIGLAAGGATGALIGLASGDDESGFVQFSAGDKAVLGGVMLGVVGGVIGAVSGALNKDDRWREVPRDRLRMGVVPQRDGRLALGMAVRF